MACESPEKVYKFRFIKWMFFHEGFERFGGIIERYIIVSFSDHDIEESPVLIPGKYSLAIGKGVLFHNAIQEKIDIPDNTISPILVGKGAFSVFSMVHQFIPKRKLMKDEYLIEKKKGKLSCE